MLAVLGALLLLAGGSHAQEDDHGDAPSALEATLAALDAEPLQGRIDFVGDVDCFMFQAPAREPLVFEVTAPEEGLRPLLLLFDRDGETLLRIVEAGEETPATARLSWQAEEAGFYFLCVRNVRATEGTGPYALTLARASEAPAPLPPAPPEPAPPETPSPPEEAPSPSETAPAPALRVGLLAADDARSVQDVQAFLSETGRFEAVEVVDVARSTPSTAELERFAAVLVWSDDSFADPVALGDALAAYVDRGGGVVVAAVSFDANHPFDLDALEGRFAAEGYYVIAPGVDNTGDARRTLGPIQQPDHPILAGVRRIDGGRRSFHSPTRELTAGGQAVASWDNGDVLVAVKTIQGTRRADLNLFPPSARVDLDLWPVSPTNDVPQLLANALLWVAGR